MSNIISSALVAVGRVASDRVCLQHQVIHVFFMRSCGIFSVIYCKICSHKISGQWTKGVYWNVSSKTQNFLHSSKHQFWKWICSSGPQVTRTGLFVTSNGKESTARLLRFLSPFIWKLGKRGEGNSYKSVWVQFSKNSEGGKERTVYWIS